MSRELQFLSRVSKFGGVNVSTFPSNICWINKNAKFSIGKNMQQNIS